MKFLSEKVIIHLVLTLVQLSFAGSSVLIKVVLNTGINPYVFAVYRDAVAVLVLLPMVPVMERGKRPRSYPAVIIMCVALSLIGVFGLQLLYLIGLSLCSLQLAAALFIAIPAFTFVIAAIFRTDENGLLKAGGVAFCVGGAAVMTLFKGPALISQGDASHLITQDLHAIQIPEIQLWENSNFTNFDLLQTQLANWRLGSLLLVAACICVAASANIQASLLARYPAPVSITTFTHIIGAIMLLIVSWFKLEDSSLWTLKKSTEIIAVVYAGVIPSALAITLFAWCVQKAGPLIVISYVPVQMILSTILGMIFLKEALRLGSLIGALLVSLGLYLVIWGQQRDRVLKISLTQSNNLDSSSDSQAPFLDDDLYNNTGKRSETSLDADSEDSIRVENFTDEDFEWPVITEHLEALGKLDFPKVFFVLSYVAPYRLEDVLSIDDIHELQGLPMANVESKLGQAVAMKSNSTFHFDRKGCGWDPNKTHSYHCYVDCKGNCTFKGPFLEHTKTHLQRVLGDEHVLQVHFAEEPNIEGKSKPSSEEQQRYHKLAKGGILVGLRRYQFFVFKDGGKEVKRQNSGSSSVRCYFVCTYSCAEADRNSPYILFNKPIHEARRLFMHVHTVASLPKYMARFSLILSKTIKFEGDISDVDVKRVKDIPCLDENQNEVHVNGGPLIHTDGTGFISEDLALQCPRNTYKPKLLKNEHSERTWDCLEMDDEYQVMEESIGTVTNNQAYPLLLQCRLFYNGSAIKGTFLVNKQLPLRTIYVRESMIKVEEDKSLIGCKTINSLEICGSSHKPNRACLSRNLIALLNYGGVPRDFFIGLVTKSLEDIQIIMRDPQKAMKVLWKHQVMDEDYVALRMVSCGIPLREPYLQHQFKVFMGEEIKKFKKGRVYIDDTFYLMGTADPTGKLKPNQVCVILDHGQVSGKVLVYRNPGLHFGDIHAFKATYIEDLEKIVGTSKFAIFFSTQGPRSAADEIAKGDFDGDLYWVSMNVKLLEHFHPGTPWTRPVQDNTVCQLRPKDFSSEKLEKRLFDDFLNLRFSPSFTKSIAAESWLGFMDRLLTLRSLGTQHDEECETLKEKMSKLTDIYYEAVDASKTGNQDEVPEDLKPEKKPHFMTENTNDIDPKHFYRSSSILGDICNLATSYDTLQSQDIWTIPCFQDRNVGKDKILWLKNYEKYRHEMSEALEACDSYKKSRARSVIQSYKEILYDGADSLQESTKPRNQIYNEAISIYQVVYEYAQQTKKVSRCSFAWKVAGEALCEIYARSQPQQSISCLPSILWAIIP